MLRTWRYAVLFLLSPSLSDVVCPHYIPKHSSVNTPNRLYYTALGTLSMSRVPVPRSPVVRAQHIIDPSRFLWDIPSSSLVLPYTSTPTSKYSTLGLDSLIACLDGVLLVDVEVVRYTALPYYIVATMRRGGEAR
ncbi:hypothetical protein F5B22DRAFT_167253 [Xylaria bambusicola]|uniref:uncharacterized protein n=1 Tax=Xylaria bambusicola TaxID=326684 RepID=UPI002008AC67|nr:uncharacterized protein F5B22DRAFT_167253 [Xylaria bambusicola]KAI0526594.1 hypothetical protein F5B22DRAFT_167253 [Xylaria bambusicola]